MLSLNRHIWRGLSSVYVCVCSFCSAKRKYDNVHGTQAGVQHKRTPSVSTFGECHSTCARARRLTHIPSILPPLEPAVKTCLSSADDVKVTKPCYFEIVSAIRPLVRRWARCVDVSVGEYSLASLVVFLSVGQEQ